jgi:potassium-transporting ATPase potassium-binding subunit
MSPLIQIFASLALLLALAWPLGLYIARVYEGRASYAQRLLGPVERLIYRLAGVDPAQQMRWQRYASALLLFNLLGFLAVYLLQRAQALLPLNPDGLGAVAPDLAMNTAISFMTNTNWQAYGGESTMSYLTQMSGLGVQNFVSAATGIAVAVALTRGLRGGDAQGLGCFWQDITRAVLYVLLPLSVALALALVAQGVPQTFEPAATVTLLEPQADAATQQIARGPVASQVAIKQLGTNGGGFYSVNSAHPLEDPTPLSDLLQWLAILLIPAALCFTFGQLVGDRRQGAALLATMSLILCLALAATLWSELQPSPAHAGLGVDAAWGAEQPGGNMEGKEVRFGPVRSALWAVATTAASNGSVNSMHDSYLPLGGMVLLILIQLGEVIFGGVGAGLYGMLAFVILATFVAGQMIGRSPEYLGKRVEPFEIKMATLAVIIPALCILVGAALGVGLEQGRAGISNPGPHGFTELLYAVSSASGNNGSAFAGLGADSPFYNTMLGLFMLLGRFGVILPMLAVAGSMRVKRAVPATSGTLPTHEPMFVVWLAAVILLVGALTFFPALALGPIAEQLMMSAK